MHYKYKQHIFLFFISFFKLRYAFDLLFDQLFKL